MSGIDKIIKQIEDDTAAVCAELIESAEEKAAQTVLDAQTQAQQILSAGQTKTDQKLRDIRLRAKSSAAIEEKKIFLDAKQNVIGEMLSNALKELKSLPDDEYFALILKMVEKNSQDKDGVISFSKKDIDRLPAGFEKKLNESAKGTLTLSQEPIGIDAGFVLSYGGIEENCSFDAVFSSEYESLSDKASALLF